MASINNHALRDKWVMMGTYETIQIALSNPSRRGPHFVVAEAYVPDLLDGVSYVPSLATQARLAIAGEAVAAASARAAASPVEIAQMAGLLARSEGIGSSTIEGYHASLEKVIVESAMDPRPHTTTTAGIIRDGIEAITFALESLGDPSEPVTAEGIAAVQRRLLANQNPSLRGYRRVYVQIGGDPREPASAHFIPPPHGHVSRLVEDLCAYVNRDDDLHPIARAAIAHAQFETIHPFPDGNGRTGRALLQAMLRREGLMRGVVLPISTAISRSPEARDRYIDALNQARREPPNVDALVEAFADFTSESAALIMALVEATERSLADLRRAVAEAFRSDSVAHEIVGLLVSKVGVTAAGVAAATGVANQNARTALEAMQERGLVDSRAGGRSGRVYFAPAILEAVAAAGGAEVLEPPAVARAAGGEGPWSVLAGKGRGRPRATDRCGAPMRDGAMCSRPLGHPPTGHRR